MESETFVITLNTQAHSVGKIRVVLIVKADGTYSYHCASKGYILSRFTSTGLKEEKRDTF
jgi:hypothetical protein